MPINFIQYSMHKTIFKQSFIQIINKPIVHLSSFDFSILKQKQKIKVIDFSKPSIKILIEPLQIKVNVDHLKKSHQLDVSQSLKIYRFKREDLSIGQVATIIMEGDLQAFEVKNGFDEFRSSIQAAFQVKQQNLQTLGLHLDNHLQNFLKISTHVEKHTNFIFARIILSFLTNYIQNYENLPKYKLYKITTYLTERSYISKNIIKHFKNLSFDFDIVNDILKRGTNSQIKQIFQTISGMLETILNLQKCQKKGYIGQQKVLQNMKKQDLISTFFKLLKDPIALPILLSIGDPSQIFINELFQSHKKQYFQIIKQIFQPTLIMGVRISQNMISTIFDNLYLYSIQSDKQQINKILQAYTKAITNFENDGNDYTWGGSSLILLCDKFQYFSNPLANYIVTIFLRIGTLIKCNLPLAIKKNRVQFKNSMMIKCFQLGIILKLTTGRNLPQQNLMMEIFSKRFQSILQLMHRNEEAIGAQNYIFQYNQQQIRNSQTLNQNTFNHYQEYDEFYVGRKSVDKLIKEVQKMQKQLKIKFYPIELDHHSYPIISKLNFGARLKIFIWNTYVYSYTARNMKYFQQLYNLIDKNPAIMKAVEQHIAYPGLLEGLFLLYHSVNNRKLLQGLAKANKYNKQHETQSSSLLEQLVKKKRSYLNQQYHKFLGNSKQKQQQQLIINPLFAKNIQTFVSSLRAKPSIVYNNQDNILKVLKNQYLSQRYLKYEKFRKRFTQELRILFSDSLLKDHLRGFAYFVDYPFVADFYLIHRSNNILVIFVSPREKMFLQSLDENKQNATQKQQQKNKNRYVPSYIEQSVRHFRSKSFAIILISKQQEIKNLRNLIAIADRKK